MVLRVNLCIYSDAQRDITALCVTDLPHPSLQPKKIKIDPAWLLMEEKGREKVTCQYFCMNVLDQPTSGCPEANPAT